VTSNTLYVDDIFANGNITANGNVIANKYGVIGNVLYVGPGAFGLTGFNNPIILGTKAGGDFVQSLIINTANTGSSDWVAQGDNGNDTHGYGDFGFTGSNFSDPLYTITGNNDTYIFSVGVGGANLGGNLVFATSSLGQNNDIVFATGGFLAANEKMRFINAQGQLYIETTTPATNTTTGALRVAGGVGVAGNLYVGGLINSASNINGANLTTGGNLSVTGNANVGNLGFGSGQITGTGNITGGNLSVTGNANVGNLGFGSGQITGTGNITGGNLIGTIAAGSNTISTTGNANVGNLEFGSGQITGTGNITGGNIIGTIAAGSNTISTTGNANVGLLSVTGNANVSGNTVTSNLKVNLELSGNTANFSGNVYAPYFVGNISGNIAAPGSNTYVLFNDNNLVNGVANFTFQNTSNTLTTDNISLNKNLGVGGNANITGNILSNGSITTANSFNLSNTSTGNNIFSVQDQSGTPVIEMGRIDSNPSTPAIDFHSGSTLVDYDSRIQASSGTGATGGGNLTVTANYFNVSNNLIANGNANISGNTTVTGNITANNFIAGGGNITGANLVSANYFTGTLTTNAQPNITSVGTLSNLFISGNLGVGTSGPTSDSRVTILAIGQTNVYPVTGNSIAAGTDLHISGGDGNLTRITQDSFGLNTYVAFTGRAAGGTAAAPTQTLNGAILSQFTGRGFSNGSLQFGNNSTGRLDIEAAENFTDTSRSTNVAIYTTSIGNINPTLAATFDGNGNLTVVGSITSSSGNSNLGNSITANFVSVSSNTVTNNLKVNLEFSGNTANFSGNIITANANLGNVANANFFSGNGAYLTGIRFANLIDANTANLTINEIYLQGVTNLAVNHTGATAYTFDQYPGSNPTLYAVAGTTLAFDLTAAGHPFQIQYANGTDYSNGLFHVTTTGVVSTGASAQSQTSGTLYFKIPGDLNSNLKYQCFNHVAMNGNIIIQNANIANLLLNFTGNINANYFTGNGSLLTGIGNATNIVNGNSNVVIAANGNVTTSIAGNANVLVVTGTGANIAGYLDTGSGNINTTGNVSGGYILGNGSQLTGINFSNLADATTAGLTINEVYLQGVTKLNVNHTGATAYTFDQYPGSNPSLYVVAGTTLAFDLTTVGHPFQIQYANGTDYSNGLFHVTTTGVVSTGASAQSQTSGTLYWKVPGDINGTFKYQCQNHVAMVGNIFVQAANIGNVLLNYTGNLSAGNANLGNAANANYFIGNGYYLTGIDTAGIANGNSNVKIYNNANVEISSNGIANVLTVTGSAVLASQNVYANTNTIQGNVIVGNTLTGNLSTAAQPNITSVGSLTSLTVTGDIIGNTANFSGAAYSNASSISAPTQLATKSYVDNQVSTGIQVHPAVNVSTTTNLTATYTPGGTNPTVTSIVTGNTLISTAHNLNTTDMFVPTVSSSGLTSGTPYFVYSVANANAFTLTASWAGPQLTGLTDGTGLSITSNANPGVGAKLTNSGTQAAITIDNTALLLNDRVLVQNQSNAALNGVYYVSNIGSISTNWELTRATDADEYFPQSNEGIAQGAYFYVEDGDTLAGGSYVIATTGILIIGTTGISFSQFSAAVPYTGVSPVVVTGQLISLANTTGSTDVVVLGTSPNLTTPNIGNATGNSLTLSGNGLVSAATVTASANVTAGNVYANSGTIGGSLVAGTLTTAAQPNITSVGSLTSVTVSGNANVANLGASGLITATGNVSGGNVTTTGQLVSSVATGTAPLVVTSTTQVSNLFAASANVAKNSNVAAASSNISYPTFAYANITGDYPLQSNTAFSANFANGAFISTTFVGNVVSSNITSSGGNITGSNLVSANYVTGTLTTAAQPNITSVGTLSTVTVSGNANVGNLGTIGLITATGNVSGGNLTTTGQLVSSVATGTAPLAVSSNTVVPNLNAEFSNIANYVTVTTVSTNISYPTFAYANLTGSYPLQSNTAISANLANGAFIATTFVGNVSGNVTGGALANGNSNVNIPAANGNVNISAVGNANILVVTGTGANISGTANVTGNANIGGNVNVTSNVIAGNVYANSGTIGGSLVAGTLTTAAQPNITSLGALTGLTVSNATGVVNFTTTANVTLGAVANLKISGGSSGYVLSTDGASNLSWVAQTGGGGSGASISNGTSNVNIPASSGNVNISSAGNANIVVITGTGMNVAGTITATGNITGGNLITSGGSGGSITGANSVSANYFTGTLTTAAQPNITSLGTLTGLTSTGTANFTGASNVSLGAVGNVKITGGSANQYLQTDGTGNLSFVTVSTTSISNGNSNVNIPSANGNVNISAVGNANILVVTGTGANITGTANITGNLAAGNISATTYTGTTANITGQFISTLATGTAPIVVTSTTVVANLNANALQGSTPASANTASTIALRDSSGNLSANFFIGNGSQLTGISSGSSSSISNGNSNVNIPAANGNVNISAVGNANVVVVTGTGMNVAGTIAATGNITGANLITSGGSGGSITGANSVSANYFIGENANITGQYISTLATGNAPFVVTSTTQVANLSVATAGTATTVTGAAQSNITSVGTLSSLGVSGTVTASQLVSNVATGTAPLTVTSTTVVPNLYVARANVSDYSAVTTATSGNYYINFTNALTGNVQEYANAAFVANTSNGALYATTFVGNITGNISNGSLANGNSNVNIPAANGNVNISAVGNANVLVVTGTGANVTGNANITGQYISTLATGTAPIVVTSTTVVANLNSNALQGSTPASANTASTIALRDSSGNLSANFFIGNGSQLTGISTSSSSLSNGNSNVNIPAANGNVNISAVGNANVVVITGTGVNIAGTLNTGSGNINTTGNISGAYFIGNGSQLTGISAAATSIANGNSNINIPAANGNVTFSSAGNANVFVVTGTGVVAGSGSGGNITGANLISANYFNAATALNVIGTSNLGAVGNVTITGGTANYFLQTNGSGVLTWAAAGGGGNISNGNSNVNIATANGNVTIAATGNTTMTITGTGANITGNANITGQYISSLATGTAPLVVSSTTVVANLNANALQGSTPASANTASTIALRDSSGNLSANFFIGNGSQLTGISSGSSSSISNGNSNVNIATANGNVTIAAVGNTTMTITGTGANITGTANITGNVNVGNLIGPHANGNSNINIPSANGNINFSAVGNANILVVTGTGANITGTANVSGNVNTGNTQINSLGVGTAASGTAGEIRATNNITAYYSDDRLKTRLGAIVNALEKVSKLSGFYYEPNEIAQALGYDKVREVGVSAQEVQNVLPEIVVPAPIDDKYLTVRYEKLVPLLIEAIKELKAEVEELKKSR
jgi:hypothetical protein